MMDELTALLKGESKALCWDELMADPMASPWVAQKVFVWDL